jgi:guanylate kinase
LVEQTLGLGKDVLFDIDWQGTQQLQQTSAASDLVRTFILPPDLAELERRLIARNSDDREVIAARMHRACDEIRHWGEYDYVLLNENVETCLGELKAILQAERLRRRRQIGLANFVRAMLGETL